VALFVGNGDSGATAVFEKPIAMPRGGKIPDTEVPPIPVAAEAEGVRMAFERYAAGVGYQAIAAELNARGLRPRSKRGISAFSASSVQSLIENRFYAGYVTYHGEERGGAHEPAITLEQWHAAHRRIRRATSPRSDWTYEALLVGGLAECALCGGPIWSNSKAGEMKYTYYRDPAQRRGRTCASGNRSWRSSDADAIVTDLILNMGPTDGLLRWAERAAARGKSERNETTVQRAALLARRERATDAYVAGARDREWWQMETARIDRELAALPPEVGAEIPEIGARLATLADAWSEASPRERHEAATHLFERVRMDIPARALDVKPRPWAAPYFEAARTYVQAEGLFTPDRSRTMSGPSVWYEPAEVIVRRHVSEVYVPAPGERIRGAS